MIFRNLGVEQGQNSNIKAYKDVAKYEIDKHYINFLKYDQSTVLVVKNEVKYGVGLMALEICVLSAIIQIGILLFWICIIKL